MGIPNTKLYRVEVATEGGGSMVLDCVKIERDPYDRSAMLLYLREALVLRLADGRKWATKEMSFKCNEILGWSKGEYHIPPKPQQKQPKPTPTPDPTPVEKPAPIQPSTPAVKEKEWNPTNKAGDIGEMLKEAKPEDDVSPASP